MVSVVEGCVEGKSVQVRRRGRRGGVGGVGWGGRDEVAGGKRVVRVGAGLASHSMASGTVSDSPTVAAAGEVSMTALAHNVSDSTLSAMP